MVAEVQLYWIIYNKCGVAQIDLAGTKLALQAWQQDWMSLFGQSFFLSFDRYTDD